MNATFLTNKILGKNETVPNKDATTNTDTAARNSRRLLLKHLLHIVNIIFTQC